MRYLPFSLTKLADVEISNIGTADEGNLQNKDNFILYYTIDIVLKQYLTLFYANKNYHYGSMFFNFSLAVSMLLSSGNIT